MENLAPPSVFFAETLATGFPQSDPSALRGPPSPRPISREMSRSGATPQSVPNPLQADQDGCNDGCQQRDSHENRPKVRRQIEKRA